MMRRSRQYYGKSGPELLLLLVLIILTVQCSYCTVEAVEDGGGGYRNYSVGGSLGWYDKLQNPIVDYQTWADSYAFSLGDFLVFNADNNHSVIQTYNFTTFSRCDYNDASNNDTLQWSSAIPSSTAPHPVSVAVPLVQLGATYFFSGDYDGEQCQNGQRFQINVTYDQGLQPSLQGSPVDSLAPIGLQSGGDDAVPVNFDNPKDVSDCGDQSASNSNSGGRFGEGYSLVGVCIFCWLLF